MILARILILGYLFVSLSFLLNGISAALFSEERWQRKVGHLTVSILLALIWPIALASAQGRDILLYQTFKL